MTTAGSNTNPAAFRLKGTLPALTMLCLQTDDVDAIERQLVEHISQMPQFFLHAPVMLDLAALEEAPVDLARIGDMLRSHRLVPVAVRNPTEVQRERAVAAGWGVLQSALVRPPREPRPERQPSDVRGAAAEAPTPPPAAAMERQTSGLTVRRPIRSGQMVRAVGGDLVVLAPVSSGAELIADGNIHVYAPFRGRAIAGVNGNLDASIFCTELDAEFLSIAGHPLVSDDIPPAHRGKPARVYLDGDELVITRL
ncbi:MAG TPA: septum site-determining protein MinC [Labilithrix sp.]|nr:septum site-determining protein MinC [Labilithrix sp.]